MSENKGSQAPSPVVIPQSSTLAVVSLIFGIVTWFLLPIIGAIVAIATGHRAKSKIRESQGHLTGEGMATAGLVLGYLQIALVAVSVCIIVGLALLGPAIGDVFSNIVTEL